MSRKHRAFVRRLVARQFPPEDILSLIQQAMESGDRDEAFWRAFLAGHFGRTSADPGKPDQVSSATRLLCAFGRKPYWTWKRISADPLSFRGWLLDNRAKLETLKFGNHRKYESQHPLAIWSVIESLRVMVQEHGGHPAGLLESPELIKLSPADRFGALYWRFREIERWRRTASFDFICLLADLRLIDAEPASCYLKGATGPLKGARRIWGDRPPRELDRLAAALAIQIGGPCRILEDALCVWQKA